MTSVTVRTPAKINLVLRVGPRRPDGYHTLATVYQAIGLYDDVRARPSETGEFSVHVHGGQAHLVPSDESNLAVRAAQLLAHQYGVDAGVALHIHKQIPVAGGMAGGSSDAAAALVACTELWGLHVPRERMSELAAQLGSDVAFCLWGGTALGSGRGEVISPVLARGVFHWVVALAGGGLSTPRVYAELDRLRGTEATPAPHVGPQVMLALREGSSEALGAALGNDLQCAATSLRPDLLQTLDVGEDAGALGAMVSGSGPTTVFLAADAEHADAIAGSLSEAGVCEAVLTAVGPVPGGRVVG